MKLSILAASLLSALVLTEAATTQVCEQKYSVTSGDTCKSIATKYGITEAHLKQWNKEIKSQFDCSTVKAGDSICVKYASTASKKKTSSKKTKTTKHTKAKTTRAKTTKKSSGSKSSDKSSDARSGDSKSVEKRSGHSKSHEPFKPTGAKPTGAKPSDKPTGAAKQEE